MQDVIFTYTDLYKKFTDDADFKRQYLDFVFDKTLTLLYIETLLENDFENNLSLLIEQCLIK